MKLIKLKITNILVVSIFVILKQLESNQVTEQTNTVSLQKRYFKLNFETSFQTSLKKHA